MKLRNTALLLLLPLLPACGGGGEDPTRRLAREAAARDACIAEDLLLSGREQVASLDTLAARAGGSLGPMAAAHVYAQAYRDYADLRGQAFAYMDSALSARTPADSTRYARMAETFMARPPGPRSVEANVAEEYAREFATRLNNPAHYCNRELVRDEKEK